MEQPSMAHLEVVHPGPEFDVLQTQAALQRMLRSPDSAVGSEGGFLEVFRFNSEATLSEWEEIRDRLPWKAWKEDHRKRYRTLTELSDTDRLEIQYELIDCLHFLLNMMIAAGFTSWHEVESFYYAKNRENLDRQERGY